MRGDRPYLDEELIRALNHRLRRQILRLLHSSDGPLSPTQILRELELGGDQGDKLSEVSYHTRVLADLNAISMVEMKMVRGTTEHFYASLVSDAAWVRGLLTQTRESDEAGLWPGGRRKEGAK